MTPLEKEEVKLDFFCELLDIAQEVKEVVRYLLKNQAALSVKYSINPSVDSPQPHIYVQWSKGALDFTRKFVAVNLGKQWRQDSFSFKPKSVEHFIIVLNILSCLPKGTGVSIRRKEIMKIIKTAEKHKEVSIEELLVLLKLKAT